MVDLLDAYIDKLKEDYIKLEQENKQLEEQHDWLIDEFQKEREKLCKQIKQESDARERFVEKVKQLKEQLDKKDKEIGELKNLYDKIQESRRIKKFVEDAKLKELDMKFKVGDTVVNLNVHWTGIIKEIEKWGSDDFYLVHYENGSDYWEEEKSLTKEIKE